MPALSARPSTGSGRASNGPPGDDTRVPYESTLRDALHRVWGFSDFRPLQREAMHAILEGRDSVVVLPTGGGKSLCFQAPAVIEGAAKAGPHVPSEGPAKAGPHVRSERPAEGGLHVPSEGPAEAGLHVPSEGPAEGGLHVPSEGPAEAGLHVPSEGPAEAGLHVPSVGSAFRRTIGDVRTGVALVISPLISLMKDQVDGLRADGVAASYLNSTLLPHERDAVLASVHEDRCRLLYVSPERIVGEGSAGLRRMLRQAGVRFIAVDEAHCISQWGHDFRPEYRQLGRLRDDFPDVAMHAFTATATERVRRDIVTELRLRDPLVLVGSFDRSNLTYRVIGRANLRRQLIDILARHPEEAGIVYCLSRRDVEALADWLVEQGYRALPYHAGLDDGVRSRHQEAFLEERVDIIVATVAFGMGIDRSNVRFIVHAGAPRSPEHYQQESGRAGRDGLPAECVLIYSGADFVRWRQLLESNGEWSESARTLLRDMERYAASTRCRHRTLVEYFGQTYAGTDCRACDWCLKELDPVTDSVTLARKILSCVARVKQTWGIAHVADVLTGRATDKVVGAGHAALSTFGLLRDESASAIRGYIEQLVGGGLLQRDGDPYPVLRLTAAGTALMRGDGTCTLYREVKPPSSAKRSRSAPREGFTTAADSTLFDRLRAVRLRLARERGVPPYVIFHDTTLRDMAQRRPRTVLDLHEIYGVGAKKAADFGQAFLEAINNH